MEPTGGTLGSSDVAMLFMLVVFRRRLLMQTVQPLRVGHLRKSADAKDMQPRRVRGSVMVQTVTLILATSGIVIRT